MRKKICMFFCIIMMLMTAGCGNNNTSVRTVNKSAGVSDALNAGMAEEDRKKDEADEDTLNGEDASGQETADETERPVSSAGEVDVDLTVLSGTMVYAEVYDMMTSPEDYIGKTVKMNGVFASYHDETTDKYYFACIVSDATACCSQGIEFVLTDEYSYPEDYPKEGEDVCVTGEFDTYMEGDSTYCTLKNARLLQYRQGA